VREEGDASDHLSLTYASEASNYRRMSRKSSTRSHKSPDSRQPSPDQGLPMSALLRTTSPPRDQYEDDDEDSVDSCDLPRGWPVTLAMRNGLDMTQTPSKVTTLRKRSDGSSMLATGASFMGVEHTNTTERKHKHQSWFRSATDSSWSLRALLFLLTLAVLLHDLVVNPYMMVWELKEENAWHQAVAWFIAVFWTFDLASILLFGESATSGGDLDEVKHVSRRIRIAWSIMIVVVDWTGLLAESLARWAPGQNLRFLEHFANFLRCLKILRVTRLFRMVDHSISRFIVTAELKTITHCLKIILALLIYNHLVSCAWCFIGRKAPSDTGRRWLDILERGCDDLSLDIVCEANLGEWPQYVVAFHWTWAQMTPGPISINAQNSAERLFNIAVLCIGIMFGSLIVSLISGQIMSLIIARREEVRKMDDLDRFLRQNNVASRLARRVRKQARARLNQEAPITEGEVEALAFLPTSLRLSLVRETRLHHIMKHPLFKTWAESSPSALHMLCDEAVHFVFLAAHDDLFLPGQEAFGAYTAVRGQLTYVQDPTTSKSRELSQVEVLPPAWICEAALWAEWWHVGRLEAVVPSHLLLVDSEGLLKTIQRKQTIAQLTNHYAKAFHMRLTSAVPPHAPAWPNDLVVPFTEEAAELLHQDVAMELYRWSKKQGLISLPPQEEARLEAELRDELCTLKRGDDGSLERIVAVVAIKLMRKDGCILVHLGKVGADGKPQVVCKLPGSKRGHGELFKAALQRILDDDLHQFSYSMKFEGVEHNTTQTASPKYGMVTTYIRSVLSAHLEEWKGPELQTVPSSSARYDDCPVALPDLVVTSGGKGETSLYAWMSEHDMELVGDSLYKEELRAWLCEMYDAHVKGAKPASDEEGITIPLVDIDDASDGDDGDDVSRL